MSYDSSYYTSNQSSKFDFLMMQQPVKSKKIEKTLSIKKNSNRFQNDKYHEFSSLIMQSSSPTKLKSEPIMMNNSPSGLQQLAPEMQAKALDVVNTTANNSSASSVSSSSSALSTCSLSSSPQQTNLMHINNEPLYISSLSEASSPPVSSVSSGSSNKHGGIDDQYNQCQTGTDGYLDSSMSDDMDMNGNYGQVPCMGSSMNNMSSLSSRANRFFPDDVVDILNRWFSENQDYPYPDEHMTNVLAREANISAKQVRKWFANKRVRSNKCYKQNFKIKKENKAGSRKQSKSVSDCDGLMNIKDEGRHYSEHEEIDECFDQDNMRSYDMGSSDMINGAGDNHNQNLASDCELGMADICQAKSTSSVKNKNKRFSCDLSSMPASCVYNKYPSNPSSSSSSFTSSSPISHFDYAYSGSNNASVNFNANSSPLLASHNAADINDAHFSFVPNHHGAPRAQFHPQQQQQHMFRSASAQTAQELLYNINMWKNMMDQNPSQAGGLIQNSLQAAHQQSHTNQTNHNLIQNIDNNVAVNRLNSMANVVAAAISTNASDVSSNASNSKPDASWLCNNNSHINEMNSSSLSNSTASSPSLNSTPSNQQVGGQLPTTSSVTAIAAALCNQYYLMNLLQNPLAIQAALANRYLMLNQNQAAVSTESAEAAKPDDSNELSKSNVNSNKRKTLLTKCFYNETASPVNQDANVQQQQRSTSSVPKFANRSKTFTQSTKPSASNKPVLEMPSSSQLLVLASALSLQQQQQQQQQQAATASTQLSSSSSTSPDSTSVRRNKINFGVISDLIN